MAGCEHVGRVSAYHDGEMPPEARGEFQRHLRVCPQCAAELARLGRLRGLLGALPCPEAPPEVLERLHQGAEFLPSAGIRRMAGVLAAIAAMVLVACGIGLARQALAPGGPGAMPLWEAEAVARQPAAAASAGAEELLASWIVQDLSGNNEHD